MQTVLKKATVGGGCFWCMEAVFQRVIGVQKVQSGYSGDSKEAANYKKVCQGVTKHAEVVQIDFDENKLKYKDLLQVFFAVHDPTTLNRQGNDEGPQYRSVVFYHDEQQKKDCEEMIKQLDESKTYPRPIVTQVVPFDSFYPCEDYHNNYFNDNSSEGYCRAVVQPKVQKFLTKFPQMSVKL